MIDCGDLLNSGKPRNSVWNAMLMQFDPDTRVGGEIG